MADFLQILQWLGLLHQILFSINQTDSRLTANRILLKFLAPVIAIMLVSVFFLNFDPSHVSMILYYHMRIRALTRELFDSVPMKKYMIRDITDKNFNVL